MILTLISSGTSYSQMTGPRDDPIIIQMVQLEYADAEALAEVLRPFLSKEGRITAYGPNNSLIIKDKKSIVKELVKIIKGPVDSQN